MSTPAKPTPSEFPGRPATITHRQMRNDSAAVLARVAAGEELMVTNNGQPAAFLLPVSMTVRERLSASGRLRPRQRPLDLRRLGPPVGSEVDPQITLDADRGE